MKRNTIINIVGLIFILMWVSKVPYLFPHPFQEIEGVKNLANEISQFPEWLKQLSIVKDRSVDELEKTMLNEIRFDWIKLTIFITIGIISGFLFVRRKKFGYFLTFFLSLSMIGLRVFYLVKYRSTSFSLEYYKLLFQHWPVRTIHGFLVQLVLLITAITIGYLFLTRNSGDFYKGTQPGACR